MTARQTVGYHGTSASLAHGIAQHGFKVHDRPGDWLGTGVYFWQDALNWAAEWAEGRRQLFGLEGLVVVVEAIIDLDQCLDLCDSYWSKQVRELSKQFQREARIQGIELRNDSESGINELDYAFFNYVADFYAERGMPFKSVRTPCTIGEPLFPGSPIYPLSHVQIAVRDLNVISNVSLTAQAGPGNWRRGYRGKTRKVKE